LVVLNSEERDQSVHPSVMIVNDDETLPVTTN
jgi:hypothetical protein